ncbi:MAG: reprolysin-like metallopeptidase [Sandaracinaceae bacterium]
MFSTLAVGPVEVHALPWDSPFVASEGADINALRAAFVSEDPSRLNVFFVQDFLEEGTLGFAAGIPGPNGLQGTAASGVVISLDSHLDADGELDLDTMGETIAHEIGHQLGLFHTTEEDGEGHDALEGTPECGAEFDDDADGSLTAEECVGQGARNVMFWTSGDVRQTEMSADQTEVIASSVVVQ